MILFCPLRCIAHIKGNRHWKCAENLTVSNLLKNDLKALCLLWVYYQLRLIKRVYVFENFVC